MVETRYAADQLDGFARTFERDGLVLLKQHFPKALLAEWQMAFADLLKSRLAHGTTAVRGQNRHYITLPLAGVFADERIFCDPDVVAIVERVAGAEPVLCQLASDTPLRGSDYQDVHRDTPELFEGQPETPSFQLAVNFPLCDVNAENGWFETTFGTHRMNRHEARAAFDRGEIPLHGIPMQLGDVMIRDVRALHRGTPNRTDAPRPMIVLGYSRRWYFRPEVRIDVPESVAATLTPTALSLLRFMPRVARVEDIDAREDYLKFSY